MPIWLISRALRWRLFVLLRLWLGVRLLGAAALQGRVLFVSTGRIARVVSRSLVFCVAGSVPPLVCAEEPAAVVLLGEALFAEARFDQRFAGVNAEAIDLKTGDAGAANAISCATCHGEREGGRRARVSVAALHRVPAREDGREFASRRTSSLREIGGADDGWGLLHWDGEFASVEELVAGTLTGRNFGWLPSEREAAVRHVAWVVWSDRGTAARLPFAFLLRGEGIQIPAEWRLPETSRVDVSTASDEAVLDAVAKLVAAYVRSVGNGAAQKRYDSPYDAFLSANRLPASPKPGESPPQYARRLHTAIAALRQPKFIDDPSRRRTDGGPFRFADEELRGLRIFFRGAMGYATSASAGNCAECHVPPRFTDFAFHNTGVTQRAYDAVHGEGSFLTLPIPDLPARSAEPRAWLPASARHPDAVERFRRVPVATEIQRADLGLWNVYANPDFPAPQEAIERRLNPTVALAPDEVLVLTIGRFKTPTVRGLADEAAFFSDGSARSVEEVLHFYRRMSELAREGRMRNAPPEYAAIRLGEDDFEPLRAFLMALNGAGNAREAGSFR